MKELETDLLIVGGSTGGVAAALGASLNGIRVIMTEQYDWIGGQLTSQCIPPDENEWIEHSGGTQRYRNFRTAVRNYYKKFLPLNKSALANEKLNPGQGWVSRICMLPGIAHQTLQQMLIGPITTGKLTIFNNTIPISADLKDSNSAKVRSVTVKSLLTGEMTTIKAKYFIDGTDLGELLPLTKTEYVTGAESQKQTGELHAVTGDAEPENVQGFTWCFPMGYDDRKGANHIIDKPEMYEYWRDFIPPVHPPYVGKLLSWVDAHPLTLEPRQMTLFPDTAFTKKTNAASALDLQANSKQRSLHG